MLYISSRRFPVSCEGGGRGDGPLREQNDISEHAQREIDISHFIISYYISPLCRYIRRSGSPTAGREGT